MSGSHRGKIFAHRPQPWLCFTFSFKSTESSKWAWKLVGHSLEVGISLLRWSPQKLLKGLNQLIFKFSWNGTNKVTRLSTINEYENRGLKMIDLESMIKSLRLAWLKSIFQCNNGGGTYGFHWSVLGAPFYFMPILILKRPIFPLNSILSYFNGGLSFIGFLIVEGNGYKFCGIIKRCALIISRFSL